MMAEIANRPINFTIFIDFSTIRFCKRNVFEKGTLVVEDRGYFER